MVSPLFRGDEDFTQPLTTRIALAEAAKALPADATPFARLAALNTAAAALAANPAKYNALASQLIIRNKFSTQTPEEQQRLIEAMVAKLAGGGEVGGAWNGLSGTAGDTVAALLTPGEMVIPRTQSQQNKAALLALIDGRSDWQRFAQGGEVGRSATILPFPDYAPQLQADRQRVSDWSALLQRIATLLGRPPSASPVEIRIQADGREQLYRFTKEQLARDSRHEILLDARGVGALGFV